MTRITNRAETKNIGRAKRLFEIARFLQQPKTAFAIADTFGLHIQTARQTLNALQQIGFTIENKHGGKHKYRVDTYQITNLAEYFGLNK